MSKESSTYVTSNPFQNEKGKMLNSVLEKNLSITVREICDSQRDDSLEKSNGLPPPTKISVPSTGPTEEKRIEEAEDDFNFSRNKLKSLISKAEEALDSAINLAGEAEHPRAFEVVGSMVETTRKALDQLMVLQQQRKKVLEGKSSEGAQPQNNTGKVNLGVFIGTTAELQKQLAGDSSGTIIEAIPIK